MTKNPKTKSAEKKGLHPRNKHRSGYDYEALTEVLPELKAFLSVNKFGKESVDFSNPMAVRALNKALFKRHYDINYWEIPMNFLCPPVPGRADYIHYAADLLADSNQGKLPDGDSISVLDIGTGANCVYPLIGHKEYGWAFRGSEFDSKALNSAKKNVKKNQLTKSIEVVEQPNPAHFFTGIFGKNDYFDLTVCNPPFHASKSDAKGQTQRKWKNLGIEKKETNLLNFGGKNSELYYSGGEKGFVIKMIKESSEFRNSCFWFTTLVSKKSNLQSFQNVLKALGVNKIKVIEMAQGQKVSRILAWTFLNEKQRREWRRARW